MNNPIHQILITDCTYGSSAIERRQGETADRVLGYSARASSLPIGELRRNHLLFERFTSYYLPSDTPRELKTTLTPRVAPRRLLFHPSVSDYQLLAQVCYRQWNADAQSAGSYFAHLLVAGRNGDEPPWSALDCLKLWGAPGWVDEDSPAIDFDLDVLDDLHSLRRSGDSGLRGPPIDDRVLRSFLTTPKGDDFCSPNRQMIPQRWREMEAEHRQALFATAWKGFLQNANRRREPRVLLVVEPSVAVIFFYGIIRLLPPGQLRDEISFSTYEPNPTRITTTLAATTFHEPQVNDLNDELYSRKFVVNTFQADRASQIDARGHFAYATFTLDQLLKPDVPENQCWVNIDRVQDNLAATGVDRVDGLNKFACAEATLQEILGSNQPISDQAWKKDKSLTAYLRNGVTQYLQRATDGELERFGAPGRFERLRTILQLVATEDCDADLEPQVRVLVGMVPDDRIGEFEKLDTVARRFKKSRLATYVQKHGNLPAGCEDLWNLPARFGSSKPEAHSLFAEVLDRVNIDAWDGLFGTAPEPRRVPLFLHMIWLTTQQASQHDEQTNRDRLIFLKATIQDLDHDGVCSVLSAFQSADDLPQVLRKAFGKRLVRVLNDLHKAPQRFELRLEVLGTHCHLMPNEKVMNLGQTISPNVRTHKRMEHWERIREALRAADAKRTESENQGFLSKMRSGGAADRIAQDDLAESLCISLDKAIPDLMDSVLGTLGHVSRAKLLKDICEAMGVRLTVLPYDFERGVEAYFNDGAYHKSFSAAGKSNRKNQIRSLIPLAIIAGLIVVGYAIFAMLWTPDSGVAVSPSDDPAMSTDHANESSPPDPAPSPTDPAPSPADPDTPPANPDPPPANLDPLPADPNPPFADLAPPPESTDPPPEFGDPSTDGSPDQVATVIPVASPFDVKPPQPTSEEPKITLYKANSPLRNFSQYEAEPQSTRVRRKFEICNGLSGWRVTRIHGLTKLDADLQASNSTKFFVQLNGNPPKRLWGFDINRTGVLIGSLFMYSATEERQTREIQERLKNCVLELGNANEKRGFVALKRPILGSTDTDAMEASIQIARENPIVPPFEPATELYIEDGELTLKSIGDFAVFPFGQKIEATELQKEVLKTEIEIPKLVEAFRQDGLRQAWIRVDHSGSYVTLTLRTLPDIEDQQQKMLREYDRLRNEQKHLEERHREFARDVAVATPDTRITPDSHAALKKLAEMVGAVCPDVPDKPQLIAIPPPPRGSGTRLSYDYQIKLRRIKDSNTKLINELNAQLERYRSQREMIESKATEFATIRYVEPRARLHDRINALKQQLTGRLPSLAKLRKQFSVNVFRLVEIAPNVFVRVDVVAPNDAASVFVNP